MRHITISRDRTVEVYADYAVVDRKTRKSITRDEVESTLVETTAFIASTGQYGVGSFRSSSASRFDIERLHEDLQAILEAMNIETVVEAFDGEEV